MKNKIIAFETLHSFPSSLGLELETPIALVCFPNSPFTNYLQLQGPKFKAPCWCLCFNSLCFIISYHYEVFHRRFKMFHLSYFRPEAGEGDAVLWFWPVREGAWQDSSVPLILSTSFLSFFLSFIHFVPQKIWILSKGRSGSEEVEGRESKEKGRERNIPRIQTKIPWRWDRNTRRKNRRREVEKKWGGGGWD